MNSDYMDGSTSYLPVRPSRPKIELAFDLVAVKEMPKEDRTTGGIVIPEIVRDKNEKDDSIVGLVVATGPGGWLPSGGRMEMPWREGDKIVFSRRHCEAGVIAGEKFLFVRAASVFAKIV